MWTLTQVLLANALLISGTGLCPPVDAVKQQLNQLLPGLAGDDSSDEEIILTQAEDGALELEMRSASDSSVLLRRLPPRDSCTEQALLAATIIASWQTQIHPLLPPLRPIDGPVQNIPRPVPQPSQRPLKYELSLAATASLDGAGLAPGGSLDVSVMPLARPGQLQLRLGLLGFGMRDVALEQGLGRYLRASARTGVGYRLVSREWTLDIAADLLWGLLYGTGKGFDRDLTALGFDAGLAPSLRLGRLMGPLRLFFDVALVGWLRRSELSALPPDGMPGMMEAPSMGASNMGERAELPRIEGLFSVGLTYFGATSATRPAIP